MALAQRRASTPAIGKGVRNGARALAVATAARRRARLPVPKRIYSAVRRARVGVARLRPRERTACSAAVLRGAVDNPHGLPGATTARLRAGAVPRRPCRGFAVDGASRGGTSARLGDDSAVRAAVPGVARDGTCTRLVATTTCGAARCPGGPIVHLAIDCARNIRTAACLHRRRAAFPTLIRLRHCAGAGLCATIAADGGRATCARAPGAP